MKKVGDLAAKRILAAFYRYRLCYVTVMRLIATLLVTPLVQAPVTPVSARLFEMATCVGDHDDNGGVTIDELVRGVDLALRNGFDFCSEFDADGNGRVTVDELVLLVHLALNGCGLSHHIDLSDWEEFHFARNPRAGLLPTVECHL